MRIRFDIDAGEMTMLATDALDATEFGHVSMVRASHVEFCEASQRWAVYAPDTNLATEGGRWEGLLKGDFLRRSDALAWEIQWAEARL